MTLDRMRKLSGKNQVNLYFSLSLPYRLSSSFSADIADTDPSDFSWKLTQN